MELSPREFPERLNLSWRRMIDMLSSAHLAIADALAAGQGTSSADVYIAAAAGVLGTIIGAAVTIIGTSISTRAENLRQERLLALEKLKLRDTYRRDLENQIRRAAIGLSDAWANAIRANDQYRNATDAQSADAKAARIKMVEALTGLGSGLNALLVLPISEPLETEVFKLDAVIDSFRRSISHPEEMLRYRNAVSPAIHKVFGLLREGNVLRGTLDPR